MHQIERVLICDHSRDDWLRWSSTLRKSKSWPLHTRSIHHPELVPACRTSTVRGIHIYGARQNRPYGRRRKQAVHSPHMAHKDLCLWRRFHIPAAVFWRWTTRKPQQQHDQYRQDHRHCRPRSAGRYLRPLCPGRCYLPRAHCEGSDSTVPGDAMAQAHVLSLCGQHTHLRPVAYPCD